MIQDIDFYRTAQIYIERHGEQAYFEAMHKAEYFRETGDDNGLALWRKIADVIVWLQIPGDLTGEQCH